MELKMKNTDYAPTNQYEIIYKEHKVGVTQTNLLVLCKSDNLSKIKTRFNLNELIKLNDGSLFSMIKVDRNREGKVKIYQQSLMLTGWKFTEDGKYFIWTNPLVEIKKVTE